MKLISRLNHENVVRYYNSWEELTTIAQETGVTETKMGMQESYPFSAQPDVLSYVPISN